VDALAVGSGTVLADDPLLTSRHVFRARPLTRVVFDRRLRTPPTARLFSTLEAGPIVVLTVAAGLESDCARRLAAAGARIEAEDGSVAGALRALASLGIQSVLLEGGATLHAAAWDARLIDYVQLYVTPSALGPAGVPVFGGRPVPAAGLESLVVEPMGPDVLIEGYVRAIDEVPAFREDS